MGQYRRSAFLLQRLGLTETSRQCRYLAARCLIARKDWEETLELLGDTSGEEDEEGHARLALYHVLPGLAALWTRVLVH